MISRQQFTIKLPSKVSQRLRRAAKKQGREPSDLAAEAIDWYFSSRSLPMETPTAAELRAVRRGEAEFKRGDHVTLDEYFRTRSVGNTPRRSRKKIA
jgi:predicted transcriptional regulator